MLRALCPLSVGLSPSPVTAGVPPGDAGMLPWVRSPPFAGAPTRTQTFPHGSYHRCPFLPLGAPSCAQSSLCGCTHLRRILQGPPRAPVRRKVLHPHPLPRAWCDLPRASVSPLSTSSPLPQAGSGAREPRHPLLRDFWLDTVIITIITIIIIIIGMSVGLCGSAGPVFGERASFKGKALCHRPTAAAFSSIRRGNEAIYGHLQSDV